MLYYTSVEIASDDKVLLRAVDKNTGRIHNIRKSFSPKLYVPSNRPVSTQHYSLDGIPLREVKFDRMKDYYDFRKQHECYGDISPTTQFISENFPEVDYDPKQIRVFNFDIEVLHGDEFPDPEVADRPINSIALHDSFSDIMYVWSLEYDDCGGYKADEGLHYEGFNTENELLGSFLSFWMNNCPDIVTGWYIEGFDIPYLINRLDNVLGQGMSKALSPWSILTDRHHSGHTNAGVQYKNKIYSIAGVSVLDYLVLYRKYSYTPQESYKLDHIAFAELGDRKISYDEVSNLPELYRTNFQKFVDYNIKDVDIVKRLDEKKKFIQLVIDMAYYAKINFDDVASPIRIWDSLIYNHLKQFNIQIPPNIKSEKTKKYKGAYVKDPTPGKYGWLISIDLASLYPSLMRGINISPDTKLPASRQHFSVDDIIDRKLDTEWLKEDNLSLASNGVCFTRAPGFMPILLTTLYEQRKIEKTKMLEHKKLDEYKQAEIMHVKQYAKKVLLNSAYGAMGNPYFRWFDIDLAEAVTYSGQVAILWIQRVINEYMNKILRTEGIDYVIYIDTDSVYLNIDDLVQKLPDMDIDRKVNIISRLYEEKFRPVIEQGYKDLYEYMNHMDQLMFMDRETIADKGIWSGAKHYALRVHDQEGVRYKEPEIKITGMGFITSEVPKICRDRIRELLPIAFDGTNEQMLKEIEKFREEFEKLPVEEIARNTGVSNVKKYQAGNSYIKGTPIGSKSAIIYNSLHSKFNLGSEHPLVNDGDKIKYLFLKKYNPIGEETVGFIDYLPKEFELEEYIDTDAMFDKVFLGPLEEVLNAIGWKTKIVASLEDFL